MNLKVPIFYTKYGILGSHFSIYRKTLQTTKTGLLPQYWNFPNHYDQKFLQDSLKETLRKNCFVLFHCFYNYKSDSHADSVQQVSDNKEQMKTVP